MSVKIAAVIPARMGSTRFPGKVLFPFAGVPMIEHVRRRVRLYPGFSEVVVATCDREVAETVLSFGGRVMMTSSAHPTGMDRAAEALHAVECTHVLIVQGDEILVLPEDLHQLVDAVRTRPEVRAWNATSLLDDDNDLENHSIVKAVVSPSGRILLCTRKSPCLGDFHTQQTFMRKILGLFVLQRDFLLSIAARPQTPFESSESILQSRILENDAELHSIDLRTSYPSVNLPSDVALVEASLERDPVQRQMLFRILQPAGAPFAGGGPAC